MIDSVLVSLGAAGLVSWILTQALKNALKRVPQATLILVVAPVVTVTLWAGGIVTLDAIPVADASAWDYLTVALLGLVVALQTMGAHDIGSQPERLLKRTKDGKPVEEN